jgi:hypothetical protein
MFDVSAENLWEEYVQCEEQREDFLGTDYEDKVSRYAGPGYRRQWKRSEVDFENHSYEWISLFLPLLASGNPRVKARSRRQGLPQQLAKATGLAVNRNFQLTNVKRTIEKLAIDFAFKWSVSITIREQQLGMGEQEDPPFRPVTYRISPTRYVWDIAALEHEQCRFQGHLMKMDKEDILEAAKDERSGWNTEVISSLAEDQRYNEHRRQRDINVKRGDVEIIEIWVPEVQLEGYSEDKGYHGSIYTLARSAGYGGDRPASDYARAPRPFFGPRSGPYTYGGYLTVPDEVVPLSPLAAVEAQSEELNNMRQAASAAMEAYKRGIAVDTMAGQDVAEKIKEFEDLWVFTMDNTDRLKDHVAQIELGGITPTHITQLQILRDSLDRSSGMTEAQRGQASGAGTATEASIAQQSSGQRMSYMTEKFMTSVIKPIAEKEAWYLAMDPESQISLGEEARGMFVDEDGQPIEEAIYVGGSENSEFLEETDIEIDPISTRYTSEALEAERSAKVDALLLQVAPMIPQMPWIDWAEYLARKGEEIGDPSLGKLVDVNKALQFGMLMTGAQLSGGFQGSSTPQPRLGVDISPSLKSSETPGGFSNNARPQPNKGPRTPGGGQQTSNTESADSPSFNLPGA